MSKLSRGDIPKVISEYYVVGFHLSRLSELCHHEKIAQLFVDGYDARMHGTGMLFLLHESSLHEVVPHFVEGKSEVPSGHVTLLTW